MIKRGIAWIALVAVVGVGLIVTIQHIGMIVAFTVIGTAVVAGNAYLRDGIERRRYQKKLIRLQKAAFDGDPIAQCELGDYYRAQVCPPYADHWKSDPALAVEWYQKAAAQGNSIGLINLGYCHIHGVGGIEKDGEEGVKLIRKAADHGVPNGLYHLGNCYLEGYGLQKDPTEAVKWMRIAAEQGDTSAQLRLGVFYYTGEAVERDEGEAAKWLWKAAEQGMREAQFYLSGCFYFGKGLQTDKTEAMKWFKRAAKKGTYTPFDFRDFTVPFTKEEWEKIALFKKVGKSTNWRARQIMESNFLWYYCLPKSER